MTEEQPPPGRYKVVWTETTTYRRRLTDSQLAYLTGIPAAELDATSLDKLAKSIDGEELADLDEPEIEHQVFATLVSLEQDQPA